MRSRSRLLAGIAAAAIVVGAGGATAADGDCRVLIAATETSQEVSVCRQDVWVHQGSVKAGNLAGVGASSVPTWDATKPTAQLEQGAGGGYATVRVADIARPGDRTFRPAFSGTYTGVLDNIAVDMYLTSPLYQAVGTSWPMLVQLKVDGAMVFEQMAEEIDVPIQATSAGNGRIGRVSFAFTNLHRTLEQLKIANDATSEHTIELSLTQRYWGDGHTVLLYDEADVPSGLIFNHEKPSAYVPIKTS